MIKVYMRWCLGLGLVWACLAFIGGTASADLTVSGYDPAKHNRFNNNSQFIGGPFDWSGVARSGQGRWATMISPNYFISATHFHPGVGDTLTLYGSNSIAGPKQVVNVVGGQQIAGTDIWLGRIDTPTNFRTFEVAALQNLAGYVNQQIFVYGAAGNVSEPSAQMKVGRNTVDAFLKNFSHPSLGAAATDVVLFDYDTSTGGVGPDEAKINPGDSGAPSFMIIMGRPVLLGVHWFMYGPGPGDPRTGSADSLLARYTNLINAAMVGQQLRLIAVPEPTSLAWFGLTALAWHCRRRWPGRKAQAR